MPEALPRRVLVISIVLVALAVFGPWLAPRDSGEVLDPVAARLLPPLSSRDLLHLEGGRRLVAEKVESGPDGLVITRRGATQLIDANRVQARERVHFLLGTDKFGRDLLSRILHGARISLLLGLLASAVALGLGTLIGSAAALSGPWLDGVLMRLTDAFLAFPRLFLLLAAGALFQPSTVWLVGFLAASSWMGTARLARAQILSLQESEFILAARASGLSPFRIWRRHLMPNALSPLIVEATLRVGDLILIEGALSFLGFGIRPPIPSWGNMIADAATTLPRGPWAAFWPGLALAATVIALNVLADDLRDSLDPRRSGKPLIA